MMPNPLLSPVLILRPDIALVFICAVRGACPENGERRSVFYRNNHCSYNAAYCTVTMRITSALICLAIGAPPRPFAALRT